MVGFAFAILVIGAITTTPWAYGTARATAACLTPESTAASGSPAVDGDRIFPDVDAAVRAPSKAD
jgi:hypothetical protein